jgi:mannose/fructose/N-acetylgalactosamine-specific phosphotransferase system component IIC
MIDAMTLADALPFAMLGALLGLDVVGFPQMLVSRPIVAATAAGALAGAPQTGLIVGATLECFALETLPFGASRYPEWASASVVAGALFAGAPAGAPGALTAAVLAGLVIAWLGGWSMVQLRKLNAVRARRRHEAVARGSRRVVEGLQLFGLTADLLRGGLLTFVSLLVAGPAYRFVLARWQFDGRVSRAVVVGAAATVAAAAVWKVFHSTPGARWFFLGGIAAGLATLVVLR